MRSHLFILSLRSLALGDISVKMLLHGMSEIFLPMFSSRTFMVLWLIFKSFFHLELSFVYGVSWPLWKTVWNFFRKLKMELPFDPAIPLLRLYPKNPETPIQKNLCTPMFIAAQFIIDKYWKQPKCPSANEWIQKLWHIYTVEFYAAENKKELIPFATAWMELESIMLSEISQKVRDKYHIISPLTGT